MRLRGGSTLRDLGVLFDGGSVVGLADSDLLGRFASGRDEAGERAFAALVDRHGPMVLRVASGILGDRADAEDAFQATFLVLARKARRLQVRDTIGPWLHAVALRTARHARSARARRLRLEGRATPRDEAVTAPAPGDDEAIHQEVDRLPEAIRRPIVLCYLEGLTHDQAAHQLGWPVGTVRSRLARGRDRLRDRLGRRGLAPDAPMALAVAPGRALIAGAARLAAHPPSDAAGTVSAALSLAQGVLTTMRHRTWIKATAAVVAVAGLAAGTVEGIARTTPRPAPAPIAASASPDAIPAIDDRRPETAQEIARDVLHIDQQLLSARDSYALGHIYATEDVAVHRFDQGARGLREEVIRGRDDLVAYFGRQFERPRDGQPTVTLSHAELVAPDLLIIHGRSSPDGQAPARPFVQLRSKPEKDWLLRELWLFP